MCGLDFGYTHDPTALVASILVENEKRIYVYREWGGPGYLNDEMLAKNICDYYFRSNKGPLFIKAKLSEKKVDEQTIDLALLSQTK